MFSHSLLLLQFPYIVLRIPIAEAPRLSIGAERDNGGIHCDLRWQLQGGGSFGVDIRASGDGSIRLAAPTRDVPAGLGIVDDEASLDRSRRRRFSFVRDGGLREDVVLAVVFILLPDRHMRLGVDVPDRNFDIRLVGDVPAAGFQERRCCQVSLGMRLRLIVFHSDLRRDLEGGPAPEFSALFLLASALVVSPLRAAVSISLFAFLKFT